MIRFHRFLLLFLLLIVALPLLFAVPLFALTGPRRTPTDRAR